MTLAPVEHRFRPRGGAARAFAERGGEVLLSGPAGTGKSRAALEKLHTMMLLNPGARGLIVRKTLASLGSTALVTWREKVVPEALTLGIVWYYGGSQEEPAQYRYENGSVVVIGGMDKATKIMSSEYDVIYVQEAIELTRDDWEALTTRLRNGRISFQQLIADTNPDTPWHWLKRRCDDGVTLLIESRHEDNPVLFGDTGEMTEFGRDYIGRLDQLTGPRHSRLRRGLWVAAEGLVYETYDPAVHLIDRFDIPRDWPRYWGVDFGFTNPFVCQWWARDPDGRLYRYRELYATKRTVAVHAAAILAAVREPAAHVLAAEREANPDVESDWVWIEPKPSVIVCDHDAEGRAQLEQALGLATTAAHKAVTEGIQAVEKRLAPAGDGRPTLFLLRDSLVARDPLLAEVMKPTCTEEEFVGYVWDTGAG